MKNRMKLTFLAGSLLLMFISMNRSYAQDLQATKPIFEDGEAQVVKAFEDPDMASDLSPNGIPWKSRGFGPDRSRLFLGAHLC